MTDRDPHPDSAPNVDNDQRTDIEQIVESRKDAAEDADVEGKTSVLDSPGSGGGEGGAGGVVKNQEGDAQ
jgi:hypothetical protein